MEKKLFIVPNNDAEAIRIQQLIGENNSNGNYEIILTGQDWGASWENLEPDIKEKVRNAKENGIEVYTIEIKGSPSDLKIIDHHKYYNEDEKTSIGEKTSIEQVAEILGVELSNFDKMIAANDVGYIPKMIKLANELGISDEEKARIIEKIDELEGMAKIPSKIGRARTSIYEIDKIDEIAKKYKNENLEIAKTAIDNAYIYDERLIWIDLDNFNCQREVTNLLYKMGKYNNMSYNNIVISSIDKNRRLVYFGNREMIEQLNEQFQDQRIKWTGGETEAGFFGIQLEEDANFKEISERMRYFLEEKLLGYHRIVKKEDIIKSKEENKYGKNIRVHEISNAKTFHTAISAAQNTNAHSAFVHVYEPEEYDEKKLFLVNAGCAGCAVTKDGDIVSVFKNNDMAKKDDVEKISTALLLTAIENGGKKLDCFDGFLPKNYMKHGFIPVCKVPFNDKFAPDGWDFVKDGRPDIVFFRHNGESVEEILKKKDEGTYKIYDLDTLPLIEDYDEAVAYRDTIIEQQRNNKNINETIKKDSMEGSSYGE